MEPSTDYPHLRRAELSPNLAFRWRHRGVHTPPEDFAAGLWNGAFLNFIAERLPDGPPLGIVSCYSLSTDSSTCYVGAASFASSSGAAPSPIIGAIAVVLDYLFVGWPLRKVYFETPAFNLPQFESGIGWLFKEEARLIEHEYLRGRYWDHVILALWREAWTEHSEQLLRWA